MIPKLFFGDSNNALVEMAKKLNLGDKQERCNPMMFDDANAIITPGNTAGDMSGGFDLVLRDQLGYQLEDNVQNSIRMKKLNLGEARLIYSGNSLLPYVIYVPTIVGNAKMRLQTSQRDPEVIKSGMYQAMLVAWVHEIEAVATPGLGTGVGGYQADKAIRAMYDGWWKAYEQFDAIRDDWEKRPI